MELNKIITDIEAQLRVLTLNVAALKARLPPPLSLPPPAIPPPAIPPPTDPIDWLTRGTEAVQGALQENEIVAAYAKKVTDTWANAMGGQAHTANVKAVWNHLLAWCQNIAHDNTRNTQMGQIKSVFKYMQVEYDNDFVIAHDKLKNQLKA